MSPTNNDQSSQSGESSAQRPIIDDAPTSPTDLRSKSSNRMLAMAAAGAAALGLLAVLLFRSLQPHIYAGTVLQGNTPAPPLQGLTFIDGEPANPGDANGEVTLVFFGYTHCPDICPTTLANVRGAIDQLGDDAEAVNLWMVSVDTERDNAQFLEDYVDHFAPQFAGLSGTPEDIDAATALYGIHYQIHEADDNGEYLVDHSAGIMGIGPDGVLRIVWAPDTPPSAMADDIRALLS